MAPARLNGGARASSSFSRVSGVRRSWLTEASRAVRWSMWRWMRSRMARKATAAWRTSRAPCGLKLGEVSPRPKASAASASRSMARTWLRMNRMATAVSSTVATGQPQDEDVGLGGEGPLARRDDAQHALPAPAPGCRRRRGSGWCRTRRAGPAARPAPSPASGRRRRSARAAARSGRRRARPAGRSTADIDRSARSAMTARFAGVGSSR